MPVLRPRPQHLLVLCVFALAILCARAIAPPTSTSHTAFGRGTPIVLLHGLGSGSEDWLQTARHLARHFRVVLVDLPGHGESDMPEPFSLDRAVAALDLALADIPGGPPILVGHSLGGLIAAAEAIDHPERVRGLVLIETALRPQLPDDQRAGWLERLDHDYAGVVHAAYLDFGRDAVQGEALYRRAAALDPRIVKRWIRLAWTADLTEQATRIDVPTLAVLADRSWPADEPWSAVAEALGYAGVSRLRATRIADCGHFVMLDHPAELAALIGGFAAAPEGLKIAMR
jgi:pimeloyl-ACP methyl ester carboxylesterase